MKKIQGLAALLALAAMPVKAAPGLFVGLSYDLSGGVGVSIKVLSTNREDRPAVAAGVSYFPMRKKFGVDVGGAYLFRSSAATLSWDFINHVPQLGLGYVNSKRKKSLIMDETLPPPEPTPG